MTCHEPGLLRLQVHVPRWRKLEDARSVIVIGRYQWHAGVGKGVRFIYSVPRAACKRIAEGGLKPALRELAVRASNAMGFAALYPSYGGDQARGLNAESFCPSREVRSFNAPPNQLSAGSFQLSADANILTAEAPTARVRLRASSLRQNTSSQSIKA